MVSFVEVWSRSLDLWVTAVLKGMRRSRTRALVGLLSVLSHKRGFDAFALALIHCRGDREDSLMCLLLELCIMSRNIDKNVETEVDPGKSGYKNPKETIAAKRHQDDLTTARTLSRSILAAITPLLLHIFLSRRKEVLRSQPLEHCYSAIFKDVDSCLKINAGPVSSAFFLKSTPAYSRVKTRCKLPSSVVSLIHRDSIDRALLTGSIDSVLRQVDLDRSQSATAIVNTVKETTLANADPPDNVSGIQDVLLAICNSFTLVASQNIPCSLYQLYEDLPLSQAAVRSRVENALVYIQRLRSLDLECKFSHIQMLREAAKANTQLCQYLESRLERRRPRPSKRWCHLNMMRRKNREDNIVPECNRKHEVPLVDTELTSVNYTLHDGHVSSIVGKALLFCSENISGFVKLCKDMKYIRSGGFHCTHKRLLLLAASAMLRNGQHESAEERASSIFPPPLMVYYTFMNVIESVCSDVFLPTTATYLHPSREIAVRWITRDISCSAAKDIEENKRAYKGSCISTSNSEMRPSAGKEALNNGSTASPSVEGISGALNVSNCRPNACSMLASRDAVVKSLSSRSGRRIYLSENMALCILGAHATVFKIYFDHLRGALQEMKDEFTLLYRNSHAMHKSPTNVESFDHIVENIVSGRRPLTLADRHRSFNRLMMPYSLNAYTRLVFERFTVRMTSCMYLRAFWLSENHMKLLGRRIRGCDADVYF
ncbi:hypothetical protein X943_001028 [Babesia divergens]|uniref:Uncharacterized protein n=1 Tax=Babesia divergens TaxID=32595 RepID=A0AAD9LLR8_BABDI|nr:hypothetical protein X943_001028 [Babesia divergens]